MEWYEKLRAEFPLTENQLYFNTAMHNPMPTSVVEAMNSYWRRRNEDDALNFDGPGKAADTRERIARLINAGPREVAFVKNTSDGLNIVAAGFPWEPGDNVIVIDEDHESNFIPWLNQKHRGVQIRVARSVDHRIPVQSVWSEVDDRTRIIAISYVQYRTGFRADLHELGRRCTEHGIHLVVDGIQGVGSLCCDAQKMGVDAMSCAAYKHLLGPSGCGFLYCRGDLMEKLVPAHVGPSAVVRSIRYDDWDLEVLDPRDARRFESGVQNLSAILGLREGLRLLEACGKQRLQERILSLGDRLAGGLEDIGYDVISSRRAGEGSGLICVWVPDAHDFNSFLWSRGIRASAKTDRIERFSIHGFNLESEIDRVLEAAAEYPDRT